MEVIREELEGVKRDFGDARRTEILESRLDLTLADLITEEERVVTISHGGYKSQPLAAYQAQCRGGRGKAATGVKEEDYVEHLLVANSHTTLLLFSSKGKVYWLKTYEIPEASRTSRASTGQPVTAGRGRAHHRHAAGRSRGPCASRLPRVTRNWMTPKVW